MPSKILVVNWCSNFRNSKGKHTLQPTTTIIKGNIGETEAEMATLQSTEFTLMHLICPGRCSVTEHGLQMCHKEFSFHAPSCQVQVSKQTWPAQDQPLLLIYQRKTKTKIVQRAWFATRTLAHHVTATETLLVPPTCLSMFDLLYCDRKRMPTILNSSSTDFYWKVTKVVASKTSAVCAASGNPSWVHGHGAEWMIYGRPCSRLVSVNSLKYHSLFTTT